MPVVQGAGVAVADPVPPTVSGRFEAESPPEHAASESAAARPSVRRVERSYTMVSLLKVTSGSGKKLAGAYAIVRLGWGCRAPWARRILLRPRSGPVRSLHPHRSLVSHRPHDMSGRTPVRTVPKPWGHETIWASNDLYVGKILHINAGQALSVQYHNVKDETVYLLAER